MNEQRESVEQSLAEQSVEEHAHQWRIEEPNGPASQGVCKTCGADKQFRNWLSEFDFTTNEERRQVA